MKKAKMVASVLLLSLAVLLAGLTGVACPGPVTTVTIPIDIPLPGEYAMPNPPAIAVGFPLDQSIVVPIPAFDLPSADALNALLVEQLGESLASLVTGVVQLDSLQIALKSLTLIATQDTDFSTLTDMSVSWLPGPVDLGSAQNDAGLGTEIVLAPDAPVDLLALVSAGTDSQLQFDIAGTVPAVGPVCSVNVAAEISVDVTGYLTPRIIQWLLTSPSSPLAGAIAGLVS